MPAAASAILAHLQAVAVERQTRMDDIALGRRVTALKAYQQARFARSHADLLAHPHYGPAAHF
jgi:hypothetical protein